MQMQEMILEERLKALFGYNEFRQHQKEIVAAILERRDVLAILPTGAGKSICYQLPAMLMSGIAVVISPLISLMQDQVVSLFKSGLPAAFLNSSLGYDEIQSVMHNLGKYKLLYVAPERFSDKNFLHCLQQAKVSFFAIDEAHCISQWGHSFRPEYRQMSFLKKTFPTSPMVALTATATKDVEKDIIAQLAMQAPYVVRASFDRPNLTFHIQPRTDLMDQLDTFLKKHPHESGIIYAATRKTVDETHSMLQEKGLKVGKYHAGMTNVERAKAQHDFIYGENLLIVATLAFGMGIHKPDIRFIVHVDMPRSIEQYYQEVGRAGRDGLPSECLMLHSAKELRIYNLFLEGISDETVRKMTKEKTEKMYTLCKSKSCIRKELLRYFAESYPLSHCSSCDRCLTSPPEKPLFSFRNRSSEQHYDKALFEELSLLRRKIAQEAQVPAFIVFGDRTLIEMCVAYPKTQEEMLKINGLGPIKWERYGQAFLHAIAHYCRKKGTHKFQSSAF